MSNFYGVRVRVTGPHGQKVTGTLLGSARTPTGRMTTTLRTDAGRVVVVPTFAIHHATTENHQ